MACWAAPATQGAPVTLSNRFWRISAGNSSTLDIAADPGGRSHFVSMFDGKLAAGVVTPMDGNPGRATVSGSNLVLRHQTIWQPLPQNRHRQDHAIPIRPGDAVGAFFDAGSLPFTRLESRFAVSGIPASLRWTLYRDLDSGDDDNHNYTVINTGHLLNVRDGVWSGVNVGLQPPGRYLAEYSEPQGGAVGCWFERDSPDASLSASVHGLINGVEDGHSRPMIRWTSVKPVMVTIRATLSGPRLVVRCVPEDGSAGVPELQVVSARHKAGLPFTGRDGRVTLDARTFAAPARR